MGTQLLSAANEYLKRVSGERSPHGLYDEIGGWYPSPTEIRECCKSDDLYAAYPMVSTIGVYFEHCCATDHVAQLFGVNESHLITIVGLLRRGYSPELLEEVQDTLIAMVSMIQKSVPGKDINSDALLKSILHERGKKEA